MDNIDLLFKKIKTPEELLNFMSKNINYGFVSNTGQKYTYYDKEFNEKFILNYMLQSGEDLLKSLCGNCFDQVELERLWFTYYGYEIKTIFEMVCVNYENNYPMHSFLVFKDKNSKWNWFENSDFDNRRIHTFNTYKELIDFQYNSYLKRLNKYSIKHSEINNIKLMEFDTPNFHINSEEYIEYVLNSKPIDLY